MMCEGKMDIGVGSFVFSQGIISAGPYLRNLDGFREPLHARLYSSLKKTIPVLLLGLVRVIMVKGVEYPVRTSFHFYGRPSLSRITHRNTLPNTEYTGTSSSPWDSCRSSVRCSLIFGDGFGPETRLLSFWPVRRYSDEILGDAC